MRMKTEVGDELQRIEAEIERDALDVVVPEREALKDLTLSRGKSCIRC